jgi:histidinol phosphatase-like enzyme
VSDGDFAAIRAHLVPPFADVIRCAHAAGPPVCWCRKPMPGMAVVLAHRHGLDLARSVHVGTGAADRGFAARIDARFVERDAWLAT